MGLGMAPHPQTGKTEKDLTMARFNIDMLEVLQTKTKNNLLKEENDFLKERLISILNNHIVDSKGNRFVEIMAVSLDQSIEKVLAYLNAMLDAILDDKVVNE